MKNKYIILGALFLGITAQAQINVQSNPNTAISQENPFLDASGYTGSFPNSQGKGLYFPKTDLTTWEFKTTAINPGKFKTYFDGMIVYNSGTGMTIADPAKGGKQVAVTPGFYYFKNPNQVAPSGSITNGEWVRLGADAASSEGEWVYDATTNRINLKRSGGNLFENTVFYNKNGALQNYDFNSYPLFYANTGTTTVRTVDMDNELGNSLYKKTSNINFGTETNYVLDRNLLYVDDSTSENLSLSVESASLVVPSTNAKNYSTLRAAQGNVTHNGIGNAKYIVGGYFDGRLEGTGYSDGYVYGLRATASYGTNKSSNQQIGVSVFNQAMPTGSGKITSMYDYNAYKSFMNDSPLSVTNVRGYNAIITYSSAMGGTVSIDDARGFNYDGLNIRSGFKISTKKNYGLYIGNIAGGTELNRAIHTEAGQIRFGDLKGTGDRAVYVDADGVLKTGTPKVNSTANVECNEDNRGIMNFGRISINGQDTDAIGFCMKNSANEFKWYYIYGGAGVTTGNGSTFGTGL